MGAACSCLRNACTSLRNRTMACIKSYLTRIISPVGNNEDTSKEISKHRVFRKIGTTGSSEMLVGLGIYQPTRRRAPEDITFNTLSGIPV